MEKPHLNRHELLFDGVDKLVNPISRDILYYQNTNNPLNNQFVGVWSAISPFLGGVDTLSIVCKYLNEGNQLIVVYK